MKTTTAECAFQALGARRAPWAAALLLSASLVTLGGQARADESLANRDNSKLAPALSLVDGGETERTLELAQAAPAQAPATAPAQAAPAPASWGDTVKLYGHLEAGITGNPDSPGDNRNFGRLFDDHSNLPVVNQLWGVLERPLDPKATGWDFGFRIDAAFGTDARFLHVYDQFDHSINSSYQIALVEAYAIVHAPGLGEGGTDVKIGQFASPMSAETIDATGNSFYSHSYIFNFGVPFQHTGFLATTHVNSVVDLYFGLDTGVNAWLGGSGGGLNNDTVVHGQAGLGLNLLDGNLTIVGLTHIGPEDPKRVFGTIADSELRYLNDVVLTWKANDKLTFTTDLNYIHDDLLKASGYGGAQYLAYIIDDIFTFVARGEIWRDNNGVFVASFAKPFDFINSERGLPTSPGGVVGGGRTTYGALTLGVNIKPPVPKAIEGFVIRPELRFDDALNGTKPFVTGTQGHQVTLAADFILPFSF
ncbi:MAG: outer membrane beta-barrel protein [Alphaproteobacteria bacterium]